jgi:repressor LexA
MTEATPRQYEVLRYVESYIAERGYAPSGKEINARFGWSSPRASFIYLDALEKKGYLKRSARTARSIVILKPTEQPHADDDPDAGGAGRVG